MFFAIDSEALRVSATSPTLRPGSTIINNSDTPNRTIFEYTAGTAREIIIDDRDTGANADILNDDNPNNHRVVDGKGIVADGNGIEAESLIYLRALDALGNQTGPTITITVFSQNGQTSNIWGFASSQELMPGTRYVKTGGSNAGSSLYNTFVPCFTAGTMVRLPKGEAAVETLHPGDMVWTEDGPQPLRWTGRSLVNGRGSFAPVVFDAGTIGNTRELAVSPLHCILQDSPLASLHFGFPRVLVAARSFVGLPGVRVSPRPSVDYVHLLFDRHRIVSANGALCESFFPGKVAMTGIAAEQRAEILALFPGLDADPAVLGPTVFPVLKDFEARMLLQSI